MSPSELTEETAAVSLEEMLAELKASFHPMMVDVYLRTGPCAKYARVSTVTHMWDAPTLPEVVEKVRAWKAQEGK